MRGAWILVSTLLVSTVAGCGRIGFSFGDDAPADAGPDAAPQDLDGYWRAVSITDHETGEIFTADPGPSNRHGTIDIALPAGRARFLFVADDAVLYQEIEQLAISVTPTHWVFDNALEGTRNAYLAAWTSRDAVELEYDPAHAGSTGDPLSQHYSIRRGARPDSALVGGWQITAAGYPGGTVEPAATCTPYHGNSIRLTGTFAIDSDLLFALDATAGIFATPDCTGAGELVTMRSTYAYVESEGTTFSLWAELGTSVMQSTGTFSFTEDQLELVSTSCRPANVCTQFPSTLRAARM